MRSMRRMCVLWINERTHGLVRTRRRTMSVGNCTATTTGIGDVPLGCVLQDGHKGIHHDRATGADWYFALAIGCNDQNPDPECPIHGNAVTP